MVRFVLFKFLSSSWHTELCCQLKRKVENTALLDRASYATGSLCSMNLAQKQEYKCRPKFRSNSIVFDLNTLSHIATSGFKMTITVHKKQRYMLLDFGAAELSRPQEKSFIISFTQREEITPDPDWRHDGHLQDISNPN